MPFIHTNNRDEREKKTTHDPHRRRVDRTQTQIRRQHLPHNLRFKPNIRLRPSNLHLPLPRRPRQLQRLQHLVMRREVGLGEAGTDLAAGLVGFGIGVVACEEEGAVEGSTLAFAKVGADDDEVEGVAHAGEVVFLELGRPGVVGQREERDMVEKKSNDQPQQRSKRPLHHQEGKGERRRTFNQF
jgi:hypothetical protein